MIGTSCFTVAAYRVIATIIGCAIAYLAVTYLWPDWKFKDITKCVHTLCLSNWHYLTFIAAQYQTQKISDINYTIAKRQAYDVDIAFFKLLNVMANESQTDQNQIKNGYRLLMLNHAFLSITSTLGNHREKGLSPSTLTLFADAMAFIINIVNNETSPTNEERTELKQQLATLFDQLTLANDKKTDALVVQQLQYILDLLPEFIQLVIKINPNFYLEKTIIAKNN